MSEQKIDTGSAEIGIDEVIAASTALAWAARWDLAARLLGCARATAPDDGAARRLAVAAAAVAVHHDFRTAGPRWAPDAMAAAEASVGATETGGAPTGAGVAATEAGAGLRRRLDLLRLQYDYEINLTQPDGTPRFGPDGRDPAALAVLARRAEELADDRDDVAGSGWAAFYRGLIADNLTGDRDGAPLWFARALDAAERTADDYLAGEALRHLGDHEMESGDLAAVRASWERSAGLWAGIGNVTGVLAQQLLLADLAFGEGNPAGGTAIAAEVSRWAGAAGLALYQWSADQLIESHRVPH
ncbi:MAG TPA: hypothetical protein VMF87_35470 [Streptosporangiaceae bacterium]|nr:hypothetical protein [Streptosporangiaceae bacterium]